MVTKERFTLLKDVPNFMSFPSKSLAAAAVKGGADKISNVLDMIRSKVDHFTKNRVYSILEGKNLNRIVVVNIEDYVLPVSYNVPTKQILINLAPFGVADIYPTNPDPKNIYSCLVYGICLSDLLTKRVEINPKYYSIFSTFLLSVFIRLFGKEYGLLGTYASEIPRLSFLISCYVLASFFDEVGEEAFRKASTAASFDYRPIEQELNRYNFKVIDDFINSLSDFRVMSGISRVGFTSKFLKILSLNFLPGLEDLSRFMSICSAATISGSTIVPTFLATKYNDTEFKKIIEITKPIFRR